MVLDISHIIIYWLCIGIVRKVIDVVTPAFLRIKIQVYSFQIVLKSLQAILCLSSKTSCLKKWGKPDPPIVKMSK